MEDNNLQTESQSQSLEEKAQQLLEEKEAESRTRTYTGRSGTVLTVFLCLW